METAESVEQVPGGCSAPEYIPCAPFPLQPVVQAAPGTAGESRGGALAYGLLHLPLRRWRQRAAATGFKVSSPCWGLGSGSPPPGLPFFLSARTHSPKDGAPGVANWGRSPPLLGIQEQRSSRLLFFFGPLRHSPPLSPSGVRTSRAGGAGSAARDVGNVHRGRVLLTHAHDAQSNAAGSN